MTTIYLISYMTTASVFCFGFDSENHVTTEQVTKGGESLLSERSPFCFPCGCQTYV